MNKQLIPILFAAASMQASFVSSNGKKAFGYEDGQIIARPDPDLHSQGLYVRVLGDAGAEKLYAISYNVSGEHEFITRSILISDVSYDARWAALFEETLPQSVLASKIVKYNNKDYVILEGFGSNERPLFESFQAGAFQKALYPTTSGIVVLKGGSRVSSTLAPLARNGELPRDANGGVKIYKEPDVPSADANTKTGVAGWWAGRQTWEKGLIVAGILGLVVLALRKIKI